MLRLERALSGYAEVLALRLRELRKLHVEVRKVQASDLLVELLGEEVHANRVLRALRPERDLKK